MAPRVTILLPTHNRADVLAYSIRSVLWQTEEDFELLVVGDGCTDETSEVVAGFHDPRIRWFDLPKAPLSGYANRNAALRQAQGRYIAYAQHDDIMFPDHLARLTAAIDRSDADWAYSRPLWCTPDGYIVPFAINLNNPDELVHFRTVENHIPSCCVMHTRGSLDHAGLWPEDVAQIADWIYWRRIIRGSASSELAYCAMPTVLHFRAVWKQGDLASVDRLEEIARTAGWWPKACKLPIPPTVTEQRVFFETIVDDREARVEELRSSVAQILDRLAWGAAEPALRTWPPDGATAQAVKTLQTVIDRRESQLQALEEQNRRASEEVELLRAREAALSSELADRAAAFGELSRSWSALEHHCLALQSTIQELHSSTSWRLTRPLRLVAELALRRRRPTNS